MKAKGQKAKLGIFVVASALLALLVVVTFTGIQLVKHRVLYHAFFAEAVGGLQVGAPVRVMGVRVGDVVAVELTGETHPRVKVSFEVAEEAPIYKNASASLSFQGITGMKDLLVSPGTRDAGRLPPGSEVRTGGGFDLFGSKGKSIGTKVERLLENLGQLTEAENRRRIGDLLEDADQGMKQITELARSLTATSEAVGALLRMNSAPLRSTLQKTGEAAQGVARTADTWDQVGGGARAALARVDDELKKADLAGTAASAHQSIASFRELVERAREALTENERELETTMRNVRRASEDLREFSSSVRQQPSRLLFSDPPAPRRVER